MESLNSTRNSIVNCLPVSNFLRQENKDIVVSFLMKYARKDEVFHEVNFDSMKYFYCENTWKVVRMGKISCLDSVLGHDEIIKIIINYAVLYKVPFVFFNKTEDYHSFEYAVYIPSLSRKIKKELFEKRNYRILKWDNEKILFFTGESKEKGFYLASFSDIIEESFKFYLKSFAYPEFPLCLFHDVHTFITKIISFMRKYLSDEIFLDVRKYTLDNIEKRQKYLCREKEEKKINPYLNLSYVLVEIEKEKYTTKKFTISEYPDGGFIKFDLITIKCEKKVIFSFDICYINEQRNPEKEICLSCKGRFEEKENKELLDYFSLLKNKKFLFI